VINREFAHTIDYGRLYHSEANGLIMFFNLIILKNQRRT